MSTVVVPLRDFLQTRSQSDAGKVLGRSQGAIWQMLKNGREIYIVMEDGVPVSAFEKKYFPPAPAEKDIPKSANLRKARRLARALLDLCPDET